MRICSLIILSNHKNAPIKNVTCKLMLSIFLRPSGKYYTKIKMKIPQTAV